MEIIKKVLEKIVPSEEEERKIMQAVEKLKSEILGNAEKKSLGVKVMLVGSIAKGTYLKGSLDIDFFILFPVHCPKDEMRERSLEIGKDILQEWKIQYAEHPYVRGIYEGYNVDIVPCYDVKHPSEKMSAVDRTPFHTEYIRKNLKDKDEVRLLKQFLKGTGCYGAEIKIQGFSGYLAELLVLKYGSFEQVLKNSQDWKNKVILSLNGDKNVDFPENFVFIDPVDSSRNVAAALSPDKIQFFIFAAGEYLKNPRLEFFFPKKVRLWPLEKIRDRVKNFVGLRIPKPDVVDDILYSQIKKASKSMEKMYRKRGFHPVDSLYHVNDDILIIARLKEKKIPERKIHMGPPEKENDYVKAFLLKWEGNDNVINIPYKKNGRWWVEIKRDYTNAYNLLENKLEDLNLGKNLNELKNHVKIYEDDDFVKEKYATFWTEYFSGKPPWER
ncbi:MAG: CCA tRNA nucleotidyltransferase [Candidatus Thermoplasmatota archaeon]|nr:CCA tRNA nucleotidyltransferase [Candidatus Thermoplasmatota archaeon]